MAAAAEIKEDVAGTLKKAADEKDAAKFESQVQELTSRIAKLSDVVAGFRSSLPEDKAAAKQAAQNLQKAGIELSDVVIYGGVGILGLASLGILARIITS